MKDHTLDLAAFLGIIATFIGWLPNFAAGLSALWLCLRIYNEWLTIRIQRRELRGPGTSRFNGELE